MNASSYFCQFHFIFGFVPSTLANAKMWLWYWMFLFFFLRKYNILKPVYPVSPFCSSIYSFFSSLSPVFLNFMVLLSPSLLLSLFYTLSITVTWMIFITVVRILLLLIVGILTYDLCHCVAWISPAIGIGTGNPDWFGIMFSLPSLFSVRGIG